MKVWRIKLHGHDLYYQPVKGRFRDKQTNLGPRGKVYLLKPSLNQIGNRINISHSIQKKNNLPYYTESWSGKGMYLANDIEWRVVEYDCVEVDG